MGVNCPHCGGSKAQADDMCASCRTLFHGSAKPAAPADTPPDFQQTITQQSPPPYTLPQPAAASTTGPTSTARILKFIGLGILAIVLIIGAMKVATFADEIKYRTPEEKHAWLKEKAGEHDKAIREYASAQEAKGIFKYASVKVPKDAIIVNIEQLSDPSGTDITADAEKFRIKLHSILGNNKAIYVETDYHSTDGNYYQVGSSVYVAVNSEVPGVAKGDNYPGICFRYSTPVPVNDPYSE